MLVNGVQKFIKDFQKINYPILWGGHLVRPWRWAGETPTPQEVVEYFFIWESLNGVQRIVGDVLFLPLPLSLTILL
ncbi:hypothetical protein VF14_35520 [Nostoc linckia z18]|uniref:Uncharacterized protein n=2 Tax=Nostoc linckia TaxID=92942 RepID=A0A9Q6EI25_NOSLI|nr:hypothetical protein VF02_34665 [Nostoc linckia z1]PHJ56341.1 hypothetical protein VF05_37390 [Nostoc linckia z3]PHJ71909.1 hypothetical protein VF03_19165 [Nostoc linckia z2]PHJ77628.1 hypothetical protein VF06_30125 [Nostoc linckia z4]PHJ85888.1 hypothetical protein VF07_22755 [Nostoc linckia z6]PHJ87310.1 hypothetical protein VF04_34770 [Nostoc linckia z7]PHJ96046.1 hypothetical protein VF08_30845 [Nostoc linckia z8]PHK11395.1 hypothetical protein VF11_35610 [Nostoc linckia z14]PHK122